VYTEIYELFSTRLLAGFSAINRGDQGEMIGPLPP
jgi:hypothetical protein